MKFHKMISSSKEFDMLHCFVRLYLDRAYCVNVPLPQRDSPFQKKDAVIRRPTAEVDSWNLNSKIRILKNKSTNANGN